jgi:hypothetical protein
MKIFQIGFNKCGTNTIHSYLQANGVNSVHWDQGRLAERIFRNFANGDALLRGYEAFVAFTDMEFLDETGRCYLEAYKLFPYFAGQYPDAVFILNTRDREDWIRSRLAHGTRPYVARHMTYYDVATEDELTEIWRDEWERHHRRVIEFFSNKPYRFFICRIETDLPHRLSQEIPELGLDECRYDQLNRTGADRTARQKMRRLHERAKWALNRLRAIQG